MSRTLVRKISGQLRETSHNHRNLAGNEVLQKVVACNDRVGSQCDNNCNVII